MDPDSNTDVANTPNDQLVSILNRLSMLEQQLEQSEEKTERIELLVKTQESQIIHMQKRNAELENKFKIEKEVNTVLDQRYRQLNDNFVILKNQIQRLEEIVASIKTKSNGSENNNNPEDVDKEDKETNSRILAIKNAGEYTISQIRKLRKDYLKEECKIDLAFQALYKAEKEALGVIKKEKQVLEEAKNIRKKRN
ncbi:uncharacterized protein I206_107109 [Kwoniella pini CBS 10737]|uniref:Uncharacterized protein n=1 Tax=Kwoniella pini CBS 10737 TaxID=1296096 RepID=A0A1B9HZB0_9TREE|nr:uncharacterized protein I206_05347 [Kwoniella pini CBS 10737]OCF48568.1 hypothetical protein I206_05347 [Kwoniella pini CBS 10737]